MIFNVGVFGTGSTITVRYPAGAACKCKNGNTILSALSTTGTEVFRIPYLGTWTVYLEGDIKADSVNVNVAVGGTNYNVSMSLLLYNYGTIKLVTGGITKLLAGEYTNKADHLEFSSSTDSGADSRIRFTNSINITGYNTLHIESYRPWGLWEYKSHELRANTSSQIGNDSRIVSIPVATSYREDTMNISDLNGNYYIGLFFTNITHGFVRKVWLTI